MTRPRTRSLLIAALGLGLIGLTVVLLCGLRQSRVRQPARSVGRAPDGAAPRTAPREAGKPDAALPRSHRRAAPGPQPAGQSMAGTRAEAPSRTTREPAPPALPAEIRRETDPERRAALLRAHRLATARVRVSALRRRRALLEQTLATARHADASTDRVQQLELELGRVRAALERARAGVEQARQDLQGQ